MPNRPLSGDSALPQPSRLLLVLAFLAIYVIWGSTYLAIRYAVETIPPLLTAATRHLIAGSILYAWARWRGGKVSWAEWRASIVVGALYFLVGHGLLHWAEQQVASGQAALLIATEPVFIATLGAAFAVERRPGALTIGGFAVGTAGLALLMHGQTGGGLVGSVAILVGAFSWALGVAYSRVSRLPRDPLMASAAPLLSGAALLSLAALATGEVQAFDLHAVTTRSAVGLGFLVVFGSLVAFTAYTWLLQHCSPTFISTHAYVNPVVAVLLGWAMADEPLTGSLVASGALILAAVGLVRYGTKPAEAPARLAEQAGD